MDSRPSQETPREDGEQVEAQYEGEDVRLTSRKELSGWYSYGFAAEVFAVCAMGKPLSNHLTIQASKCAGALPLQTGSKGRNKGVRLVLL